MIVRHWMQAHPMTIPSPTLVSEAKRLLSENNLHALPVVDDGRLRGLVTRANLLRMGAFVLRTQDPDEFNYFVLRLRVRDGERDTCLYRHESPRPVRDAGVAEGDSFAIDGSAGSRVLSAFLGARGAQHEAVRRQLVLVTRQSPRVPGAGAVICPVFAAEQRLAGTLVLSGPESRFTDAATQAMKRLIVAQASALTRALGGDTAAYDVDLGG